MQIDFESAKRRIKDINNGLGSLERGRIIKNAFPNLSEKILKEAERAMNDMLVLPGTGPSPYFVGNPPKWRENPCNNKEYTFSLNRLLHLKTLSEAYSLTGCEEYAQKVLFELEDWIDSNHCPSLYDNQSFNIKAFNECSPWRALEVGIRCYRTLPIIIELTAESPYFTKKLFNKIISSLKEHLDILYNISPLLWPNADHNHYLMENLGLLSIVSMFPELDNDKKYFNHANNELDRCMKAQCTTLGGQIEGCPSYHNGCTYWFSLRLYLARKYHFSIPDEYSKKLSLMFNHSIYATRACGGNFPWGDSHTADKETLTLAAVGCYMAEEKPLYLQNALHFYPHETLDLDIKDNLWRFYDLERLKNDYCFARENPQKPSLPLILWDKELKQVYFRTSWEKNAISLMTGCRVPVKNLHAHMDPAGFDLTAFGSPIISDPGIYTYKDDENRYHFKSTSWHNVATINGKDTWEYKGSWAYGKQGEGDIISVITREEFTSILSVHNCYSPVILKRNLIITENGAILVIDKATRLQDNEHLTVFFHFNSDKLSFNNDHSISAEIGSCNVLLRNLLGLEKINVLSGKISTANDIWHDSLRVALSTETLNTENDSQGLMVNMILPYKEIEKPIQATANVENDSLRINIESNIGSIAIHLNAITLELEE